MAGLSAGAGPAADEDAAALDALWEYSAGLRGPAGATQWRGQVRALYRRGVPLETALQFLYAERPDRQAFRAWLAERGSPPPAGQESPACPHDGVLSAAQRAFWESNGYLVLPGAAVRCRAWCTT